MVLDEYFSLLGNSCVPSFLDKYLNCPSILRLKNVGCFCGMDYASKDVYDFGEYVSRFDHSLFVALITWRFTKDKNATLAALFHDISTPCFSHVIDYMNKDYEMQESTEEKTFDVLSSDKDLLKCLNEDGVLLSLVSDFKKYSIVDLDRPMFCADRVDGVILNGLFWTKSITFSDAKKIILDLDVFFNELGALEIGFKSLDVANFVVNTSSLIDEFCHMNSDNYMMELLAKITRRAIDIGLISYDDLFVLDEIELFDLLKNSSDKVILTDLDLFMNVSVSDIPLTDMPKIKKRDLNPLVLGSRLK